MSTDSIPDLWREERDLFTAPNIHRVLPNGKVEIDSRNFRQSKMPVEYILFYRFEDRLFFPIWFEFRSINNNLLFLFLELEVKKFSQIQRILVSSLEKEEGYVSEILPLIHECKASPRFCVEIKNFSFD